MANENLAFTCLDTSIVSPTVHDIRCVIDETDGIHVNRIGFDWYLVGISIGCQIVNVQTTVTAAANYLLAAIREGHGKNAKIWFRWMQ